MIWIVGAMTLVMFFMSKMSPAEDTPQQEDKSSPEKLLSHIIPPKQKTN